MFPYILEIGAETRDLKTTNLMSEVQCLMSNFRTITAH